MSSVRDEKAERMPLIVVAGPTASGKSALAIAIAEAFDGEVINADSMQVYRELEILTARPGAGDLGRVPHRLYGFRSLADPCSAVAWRDLAVATISQVHAAGRLPVLCGGTGFYIRALLEGIAAVPEIPEAARVSAREAHAALGGARFRARLAEKDPVVAARLADGDSQRLIRAWEVIEATGRSLADWQADDQGTKTGFETFSVVLMPERSELYAACDGRFGEMVRRGALEEARRVAALGIDPALPGMKALGLPELMSHAREEITLEEAIERARQATRRYAKRQMTWFRHQIVPKLPINAQYSKSEDERIFPKIRQFLLTQPR